MSERCLSHTSSDQMCPSTDVDEFVWQPRAFLPPCCFALGNEGCQEIATGQQEQELESRRSQLCVHTKPSTHKNSGLYESSSAHVATRINS
jgi:hypothetical protein